MKITEVDSLGGKTIYEVELDGEIPTTHEVTLSAKYYEKLTKELVSEKDLIERAFDFLLERESNQRILEKFDLKEINNYFPEFEEEMKRSLN